MSRLAVMRLAVVLVAAGAQCDVKRARESQHAQHHVHRDQAKAQDSDDGKPTHGSRPHRRCVSV